MVTPFITDLVDNSNTHGGQDSANVTSATKSYVGAKCNLYLMVMNIDVSCKVNLSVCSHF